MECNLGEGHEPTDAPRLAVKFRQFQKMVGTLSEHSNKFPRLQGQVRWGHRETRAGSWGVLGSTQRTCSPA